MSFDWSHYLTLANKLAVEANTLPEGEKEAALRTAISRAYYAAFKKAEEFLLLKNEIDPIKRSSRRRIPAGTFDDTNPGSHLRVIFAFQNSRSQDRIRIGRLLDILKYYRENADYQRPYETSKSLEDDLAEALEKARTVLTYLKYVPGEPRRN
jgi:uncharacterized protein (UPF0332 family)